jgi:hypothetical protein
MQLAWLLVSVGLFVHNCHIGQLLLIPREAILPGRLAQEHSQDPQAVLHAEIRVRR